MQLSRPAPHLLRTSFIRGSMRVSLIGPIALIGMAAQGGRPAGRPYDGVPFLGGAPVPPVPIIHLTKPIAEFPETFDHVNGVAELRDGRVLVTDFQGPTLQLLDFGRGQQTAIGRPGGGPNEYRMPDRPLSIGGDTLLVPDLGQHRFLRVTGDGRLAGTMEFPAASGMSGQFHGADRRGRIYYVGSRYAGDGRHIGAAADSAPLIRWDRATNRLDTLARLRMPPIAKPATGGAPKSQVIMMRPQPFGAEDDWAVTPDGRVAIIRAADYRVEWIGADGKRSVSAPNAYQRERVTRADKDRILKPAQAMMSTGAKFSVPAGKESDFVWPDYKPPFVAHFTLVTPEGRIWVQRSVAEGAEPVWDELDERGQVARRFVLPRGCRVVGFGKGVVYLTRSDEDDLLHLGRYGR